MIVTLDTNVLISATVFGGIPGRIIDAVIDRRFVLALSPAILHEYREVLSRSKFGIGADAVEMLTRDLEAHATIVHPTKRHAIVADDPDDNAIIDCAVEAKAEVIVSGDNHLTSLGEVERIQIVTPGQFVEMIE